MTANQLFQHPCLPSDINGAEAFAVVLEIAEDIAGAHELVEKYCDAKNVATRSLDSKIRKDRSVIVPAVGNIETRCNEFLQRSDHALRELFRLVRMFSSDVGSGGWVGLKTKIDEESKDIDNFSQFLDETVPFLQLIRNTRNCVEHPRPEQRLVTVDFSVDACGRKKRPSPTYSRDYSPTNTSGQGVGERLLHTDFRAPLRIGELPEDIV